MKLATVVAVMGMSTPAMAEGPYIGGFVSGGAYGEMGWTGPNSSRGSTMLGGFAGYGFQAGGLIISPEMRVYGGANDQVRMDNVDTTSWPGFSVTDRLTFQEDIGVSAGVNVGAHVGAFTPYVGSSIGVSRLKYKTLFTPPGFVFAHTFKDTTFTQSVRGGIQYDFERYFLRAEIERRWFQQDYVPNYRKTEASLGFGVRF